MNSNLKYYIDISNFRLGDRIATAWYAQQIRKETGDRFGVIDTHKNLSEPFYMPLYFPQTFISISENDISNQNLELWKPGNLWLTAANEFYKTLTPGTFEHIPTTIYQKAEQIYSARKSQKHHILIHILDDAQYNKRRNWYRKDVERLIRQFQQSGCGVTILNPTHGTFTGGYSHMLAEMLACDAFIGGDTGPSHVFAMLCPQKPQLAIYPDMQKDQENYLHEQHMLNLTLPWNSLPFRQHLAVMKLKPSLKFTRINGKLKLSRLGSFNPKLAKNIILSLLRSEIL